MSRPNMVPPSETDGVTGGRPLFFPFVEGIRGLSALYVVLHHVWQYSIADPQAPAPSWFRAATVFKYGTFAVAVFLVVSGFCLMLPVVQHPMAQLSGGVGRFARRRSARILPPYFVALALSIATIAAVPALRAVSGTPWDLTLPDLTFAKIASHLFMVHNWFDDLRWAINAPMWTVALEFQIYFVFALALLPLWRRFGPAASVALGFTVGLSLTLVGGGRVSPWMLGLFTLGMVAAWLGVGERDRFARLPWSALAIGLCAAVPVVTAAAAQLDSAIAAAFIDETLVGFAAMAGLVALSRRELSASHRSTAVMRGLTLPPVRQLGTISYSLYLVHYPIVAAVTLGVVKDRGFSVPVNFAVLLLTCVPLSVAVAVAFYLICERPYLSRKATIAPPPVIAPTTA